VIDRVYFTSTGVLTERQRYVQEHSTLVQEKFVVVDYGRELDAYEDLVRGRRWQFLAERYEQHQQAVGERGMVVAGELFGPLKMLHFDLGPENTTFLLSDHPDRAADLMAAHEKTQLDLVQQMATYGVPAMMAMDNLDTMFHSPQYVEQYSAPFYEQASRICHEHGSTFFIHACGQQRANLKLIASLGVDGLEGVASPPLGDVELDEAFAATGDRFVLTGGISAAETERLQSRQAVRTYVKQLTDRLRPFAHRFVLASACNTAITTRWEQLVWFRDAWREFGDL
jgi:uroporphyrinogen-III decarboxylase